MSETTQKGLVMRSTGSWYEVRDLSTSSMWQCRLKGKFKIKGLKVTNPIAVGDLVGFEIESEQQNTGIINTIEPRENYIIRKSVHKSGHAHLLASNLDQAVLIITLTTPRTSIGFIDRFLVTAESFQIPAVLVFNKLDLLEEEWRDMQNQLIELYESLGYTCIETSAVTGDGLDTFTATLRDKKSLLMGHSGVGKSSLMNILYPGLELKTQEVSTYANKGVHTTTFAEMFEIEPNTFVIDSPGIKEMGLVDMNPSEISHYFPEMRELLNECRFNDCMHIDEPGCVVKDEVESGEIAFSRYESYLSMLAGDDNRK